MSTQIVSNIPTFFSTFSSSYEIMIGVINLCNNLSQSSRYPLCAQCVEEGKCYLYTIHIFSLIRPFFSRLNYDIHLYICLSKLLVAMNRDSRFVFHHVWLELYRGEVIGDDGCYLAVSILNCSQKNVVATREAMIAIRSICSAERTIVRWTFMIRRVNCKCFGKQLHQCHCHVHSLPHPRWSNLSSWNSSIGMDCSNSSGAGCTNHGWWRNCWHLLRTHSFTTQSRIDSFCLWLSF